MFPSSFAAAFFAETFELGRVAASKHVVELDEVMRLARPVALLVDSLELLSDTDGGAADFRDAILKTRKRVADSCKVLSELIELFGIGGFSYMHRR